MKDLLYDFKAGYLKILNGEQRLLSPEELLSQFINFISDKVKLKDNPVPSLDDIQVIEDLLEEDGNSEFDNDPIDAYFNGVRNGIQTYFEHYYLNGVETNKEQPKCTCYYRSNQAHWCEKQEGKKCRL